MLNIKCSIWLVVCSVAFLCGVSAEDKARYDNYRIYRVHIETEEHVELFQKIEERSDSYTFLGHARHPNQNLSILVAAHKVGEITDLLQLNNVTATVLVRFFFFKWLFFERSWFQMVFFQTIFVSNVFFLRMT